ncbi:MAG: 16S rRNA (adenine(1518)-N(6)/adenine(1519)-N(6))-dimethyltransferase RsmA [Clostridiales bacterium]|nr:16S rRNA (adenine(1518)-N(6)/adenine(1519)-N(6))-dimethyltransferase RsmA [Clostridiales bacterium]
MDIQELKAVLASMGKNPNPALGQNFFTDAEKLREIAAYLPAGCAVLEVGAGLGALTRILLERADSVYAVEKDALLAAWLRDNIKHPKLTVIEGDFLDLPLPRLPANFLAAGNLPYYVTTPICERLFSLLPEQLLLMVQSEAGERFFAAPGSKNYGPIAVLAQLYYSPRRVCALTPANYWPQPQVHSVVISFEKRADAPALPPATLTAFVKTCLAMRRKTLANNLKAFPNAAQALAACQISPSARGESLTPAQFAVLYGQMQG